MLAASCDDIDQLRYPLLATQKIDGIRCLIIDGVAMSRSLKPIPNRYIQSIIGKREYNGLDGELVVERRARGVGRRRAPRALRETMSSLHRVLSHPLL